MSLLLAIAFMTPFALGQERTKLPVSVYSDNNFLCNLDATEIGTNEFSFDLKEIEECFKNELDERSYENLKTAWKNKKNISLSELNAANINSEINQVFYRLDLKIPLEWKLPHATSLRNLGPSPHSEFQDVHDAKFSAYLNYSLNADFRRSTKATVPNTQSAQLNPVIASQGLVVESYHHYRSETGRLARQGTFLLKDFEKSNIRLQLGDTVMPSASFLSTFNLLGASLRREFAISPDFLTYPLAEDEVLLEKPARVEVFVNGILVRTLNLEAGRHRIEDIPVSRGLNNVILKVTMADGEQRFVQLRISAEQSLLKKGLSDFSYAAGVMREDGINAPRYTREAAGSGIFRYGVHDQWTAGLFVEGRKNNIVYGQSNLFVTNLGIFQAEGAGSNSYGVKGQALRTSYSWVSGQGNYTRRFNLLFEGFSPKFLVNFYPAAFAETNNRWSLSSSYSQSLTESLTGQLNTSYNKSYLADSDNLKAGFDLNMRFTNRFSGSTHYYHTKYLKGPTSYVVGLNLSYSFEDNRSTLIGSSNFPSNEPEQISANYFYNNPDSNISTAATIDRYGTTHSGAMRASYGWQFADLAATASHTKSRDESRSNISLNPSGSFVFADGYFAASRHINNSYILVRNDFDESVFINGNAANSEAKAAKYSTRILVKNQAYQTQSLAVENSINERSYAPDVFMRLYRVRPKYKSASVLRLTRDKKLTVRGTIRDGDGKPLSLQGGRLMSPKLTEEVSFFTDYDGNFNIENLPPGTYQIKVFGHPFATATVQVKDSANRVLELGPILLR